MSAEKLLITGGSGFLGKGLISHYLRQGVHVSIMSRHEKLQYDVRKQYPEVKYILGDIRDAAATRAAVRHQDIVIHAASLKFVDLGEQQPREYVLTNVMGTTNLIDAVLAEGTVTRCVGISSDKSVGNIANCYGLTKQILERLFMEASKKSNTVFTVARYGNVIGSTGSVVPFWQEQRRKRLPLSVTDPTMTRFLFTLDEAVALIDFVLDCPGGVIVSSRMASTTLGELAQVMETAGTEIIGRRPGEKMHEELLTAEEMGCTDQIGNYFVYHPHRKLIELREAYTSDVARHLSTVELVSLLREYLYD